MIEKGDGLPPLELDKNVLGYFQQAGFKLIEAKDIAVDNDLSLPWYHPFSFSLSPRGILHSRTGHYLTHYMVKIMEFVHLAAPGTADMSRILMEAAEGLTLSGENGTFTPLYMLWGQKPSE